ncbi:MAG: YdcH family protein [Paracoccaceae bacterium]
MTLSSHLQELKKKHQSLSLQVDEAQRQPGMNSIQVAAMKKQKMRLKEEIARLQHA